MATFVKIALILEYAETVDYSIGIEFAADLVGFSVAIVVELVAADLGGWGYSIDTCSPLTSSTGLSTSFASTYTEPLSKWVAQIRAALRVCRIALLREIFID
jgi:hypothetical protein